METGFATVLQVIGLLLDIAGVLVVWKATSTFADNTAYNISWEEIRKSVRERRKARRHGHQLLEVSPIHIEPPSVEEIYWSRTFGMVGVCLIVAGFVLQIAALTPQVGWLSSPVGIGGYRLLAVSFFGVVGFLAFCGLASLVSPRLVVRTRVGGTELRPSSSYRRTGSDRIFSEMVFSAFLKVSCSSFVAAGTTFAYFWIDSDAPSTSVDRRTWRLDRVERRKGHELTSRVACVEGPSGLDPFRCKVSLTAIPLWGHAVTQVVRLEVRPGEATVAATQEFRHGPFQVLRHRLAVALHDWRFRPWWLRPNWKRYDRLLYEALKFKRFEDQQRRNAG